LLSLLVVLGGEIAFGLACLVFLSGGGWLINMTFLGCSLLMVVQW